LVKFLNLSNISHFTLRDRIAQVPHEDPESADNSVSNCSHHAPHFGHGGRSVALLGENDCMTAHVRISV
jgi:hypothetical protein